MPNSAAGSALAEVFLRQMRPTDLNEFQIAQLRGQGISHRPAASGTSLGGISQMNAATLLPNDVMLYIGAGAQLASGQRTSANDRLSLEGLQDRIQTGSQLNPHELNNGWSASASRVQPSELGNRWRSV
jgi:hypothetical protein